MAQIAQNTDAVHLGHDLVPKAAEPGIPAFVTAATRQVLGIVGDLHDTHAQFLPDRAGAVRRGQPALADVGKDSSAPFRDDEAVYDGERVMYSGHAIFGEAGEPSTLTDLLEHNPKVIGLEE
jgi:hypothetical protein